MRAAALLFALLPALAAPAFAQVTPNAVGSVTINGETVTSPVKQPDCPRQP